MKQREHKRADLLLPLKNIFSYVKGYSKSLMTKEAVGYLEYVDTLRAAGWVLTWPGNTLEITIKLAGEVHKPKAIHWRERRDVKTTFQSRGRVPGFLLEFPPELVRELNVRPLALRTVQVLVNNQPIRPAKNLEVHVIEIGPDVTDDPASPPPEEPVAAKSQPSAEQSETSPPSAERADTSQVSAEQSVTSPPSAERIVAKSQQSAEHVFQKGNLRKVQRQLARELSAPMPSWADDVPALNTVFPQTAEIFLTGRSLEQLSREGAQRVPMSGVASPIHAGIQ